MQALVHDRVRGVGHGKVPPMRMQTLVLCKARQASWTGVSTPQHTTTPQLAYGHGVLLADTA